MNSSPLKISVSALLLVAFALFNVGIPVVQYLCPMMSMSQPVCDMSVPSSGDGAALTKQVPSCCAKYVVAERNTTPFVKTEHSSPENDKLAVAIPSLVLPSLQSACGGAAFSEDVPPPRQARPLHLLSSSLLI